METTELERIAEIIGELGDKGLLAFVLWLALDFGKAVICWTGFIILFGVIFARIRDAVVLGLRAARQEAKS
jgi:hypothetical protein